MKTLVTYYSRSGNTKKVAERIADTLKADIDEIQDLKDRSRKIIGWLVAGRDAGARKTTDIKCSKDPSKYDLVIIGTPVWAWTMTPAVRTYLTKEKPKNVAFFCTMGGSEGKTFTEMESLSTKPMATMAIIDKKLDGAQTKIEKFCQRLSKSP